VAELEDRTIRQSVVAGSWYPGNARSLARAVDEYLAGVDQPPVEGELLGLISPHAGYTYSGQTAAYAYHQLQGAGVDTVVLMGPSHRAWVGDYAINTEDAYETPLGRVPLDRAFIAELEGRLAVRRIRRDYEHSLEIQLPFLQRQLAGFRLVPIMISADSAKTAQRLAAALVEIIRQRSENGERVLFVASSDLHHVEDYDKVVRRDGLVVSALAAYDLETLTGLLMAPDCSVCGRIPILTALQAARALGADSVKVLHHTNSGDVTGQRWPGQYTVGYMAAAIYKSSRPMRQ
jgi:AmmeMemoRadiSam system protein B